MGEDRCRVLQRAEGRGEADCGDIRGGGAGGLIGAVQVRGGGQDGVRDTQGEQDRGPDGGAGEVRGGVQPGGLGRGAELGEAGPPHHRGAIHRPRYPVQHAFRGAHDDPHREGQGDGAQPGDIAVQRVSPPQILG